METHSFTIALTPEAGAYSVTVPMLPGCVTFGRTREEAIEMAREAIVVWIEDMIESGEAIPVEREAISTTIVTIGGG